MATIFYLCFCDLLYLNMNEVKLVAVGSMEGRPFSLNIFQLLSSNTLSFKDKTTYDF